MAGDGERDRVIWAPTGKVDPGIWFLRHTPYVVRPFLLPAKRCGKTFFIHESVDKPACVGRDDVDDRGEPKHRQQKGR